MAQRLRRPRQDRRADAPTGQEVPTSAGQSSGAACRVGEMRPTFIRSRATIVPWRCVAEDTDDQTGESSMATLVPRGFSVRIFLSGGDLDGLKIVEKSNWTGSGLVFPRSLLAEARARPEFQRAGVYVLEGPDEESHLPRVYIGEGDPIGARLDQHAKSKDFWTGAVAFTSKDDTLNKAHVQYLEARLVELANEAKRCELDNGNIPQCPSLSEADTADVEAFLADMLLCFPVLGAAFFEKGAPSPKAQVLKLKAKGIEATGHEASQGFVVRKGSHAVKEEVASILPYLRELRRTLTEKRVLVPEPQGYVLTQDYVFASPSTAAGVLLGRSANGRTEWKTRVGQTLKELQEAEASAG